jgi:hypothetical protein
LEKVVLRIRGTMAMESVLGSLSEEVDPAVAALSALATTEAPNILEEEDTLVGRAQHPGKARRVRPKLSEEQKRAALAARARRAAEYEERQRVAPDGKRVSRRPSREDFLTLDSDDEGYDAGDPCSVKTRPGT